MHPSCTMAARLRNLTSRTKPNFGGDNDRIWAIGRPWCDDIVMLAVALDVQPSNRSIVCRGALRLGRVRLTMAG